MKPKLVIVHGAICGGCDVSIVDGAEGLSAILENLDVVYWSTALDTKLRQLLSLDKIDVAIFMGGVRTEEDEALVKLLRQKASIVVAYGSCAAYGGIPGLAALIPSHSLLEIAKSTVTTIPIKDIKKAIEIKELKLPKLQPVYKALPQIIEPDIVVPGCPPTPENVKELADLLIRYVRGEKIEKGVYVAGSKALCESCPRKPKDMSKISITDVRRLYEVRPREDQCFLEQGLLCLGPVTRSGCDHRCIKANLPCAGCFGPVPVAEDVGLKYMAAIIALIGADRERELLESGLSKILDKIEDRVGVLYRYTLPRSMLFKLRLTLSGEPGQEG